MRYIVGLDEVGRGALAGPVVVAAVAMPRGVAHGAAGGAHGGAKSLGKLRDSKKLSAARREAWAGYFATHQKIDFAVARVYPRTIERRNISGAANLAAHRAFARLTKNLRGRRRAGAQTDCAIFLDGGLFINNRGFQQALGARTIIKADEKITAVKAASIVAKVHRDALMRRLGRRYPAYGFEVHKGYGTKAHLRAIERCGPAPVHRLTFLKQKYTMGNYGRRTSKASLKREDRPQALASRDEKAEAFRMQKLRRAESRASRVRAVRKKISGNDRNVRGRQIENKILSTWQPGI